MSNLWTIPDFKEELSHLAALHQKRPGSPVVQGMAATWCGKVEAVTSWTSHGILELINHIDTLSLPDDMKAKFHECLEKLTIGSSQALKMIKAGQVIHNLPAYMSQTDWTKLETNATLYDHMHVIAKRLATMAVVSLRENTKAQAVALSLYCQSQLGKPEPNAMTIHNCLADFQALHSQCLETMNRQTQGPRTYPRNPQDMGTTWIQQVYGTDCLPNKQVPMAAWMNKVACRSTNKMLQTGQVARGSTHAMCDEKTSKDLLQELLAKHDKSAQVNFATGGPCSSHSLAEHRPVATPQATLFADHGEPKLPEAEKTHENTPSLDSRAKPPNLQAMEDDAFKQLQKGKCKAMKRPASKMDLAAASQATSKQKAASHAKAKPAAKTKAKAKTVAKLKGKARLPGIGPGCSKCRGDGCSTCGRPGFSGQIYPGRAAWKAHFGKPK